MTSITRLIILSSFILSMSSCASIVHGSKQDINVSSNPSKASIYVNNQLQGMTPKVVTLNRKADNLRLKLELEGYETYEIMLERKIDGWFWGNIVFGGIIGIIIDSASGAMYKLSPAQINTTLSRQAGTASINLDANTVYVAVQLEVDPSWEKIGGIIKTIVCKVMFLKHSKDILEDVN